MASDAGETIRDTSLTVRELIAHLRCYDPSQEVIPTGTDVDGRGFHCTIYKLKVSPNDNEVYMYLGDSVSDDDFGR